MKNGIKSAQKINLTFERSLVRALQLILKRSSGALKDDVLGEDVRVRRQTQLERPTKKLSQKNASCVGRNSLTFDIASENARRAMPQRLDRTRGMKEIETRINFKIIRLAASHSATDARW